MRAPAFPPQLFDAWVQLALKGKAAAAIVSEVRIGQAELEASRTACSALSNPRTFISPLHNGLLLDWLLLPLILKLCCCCRWSCYC